MKFKPILTATLRVSVVLFLLVACSEDRDYPIEEKKPVQFSSSVAGAEVNPMTRVVGNSWSANDAIGIFMKKTGQPLASEYIVNNVSNTKYVTAGNKYFNPADRTQAIFLPESENVDFIAYYPYQEGITDFKYNINLSDQSSIEKLDLLFSSNVVNQKGGSSVGTIDMSFKRKLAKLKFNISTGDLVSTLDGLKVTVSGLSTKGVLNLVTGQVSITAGTIQNFDANLTINGATATAEAIILPVNGLDGLSLKFTIGGKEFTHNFPSSMEFLEGVNYIYDVVIKGDTPVVEENYGYFETPVKSPIENTTFVLHMLPSRPGRNYSMLYDEKYRLAYWVAYPLHSYYIGTTKRTDKWAFDPLIKAEYQPTLSSSWPPSDLDRGHQLPSADRTKNEPENYTTFYYSNMTAQNSTLNQGIWAKLEEQIRAWTNNCDTMYVVTGAMITTKTDKQIQLVKDKSGKEAALPKYHFKALAQKHGQNYYTIAYKMDNKPPSSGTFQTYQLTVKELEEETGFVFFPGISKNAKEIIEPAKWIKTVN